MTRERRRQQRLLAACLVTAVGLACAACATSEPNPVSSLGAAATLPASPGASSPGAGAAHGPDAPLTGLPVSGADAARRAVALVVGPGPTGLGLADVVFQEISSPVRYIAVFQSKPASGVGPITSTQPTDGEAVSVLRAVIGYDGGTHGFIKVLGKSHVTDMGDATHASLYTTTSQGVTTSTQAVLRAVRGTGAPPALFRYRGGLSGAGPLAHTGLTRPATARLDIPGYGGETWDFDAHTGRWALVRGGPKIQAANVVVQTVPYKVVVNHGTTIRIARMIGTGHAMVLSGSAGSGGGTAAAGTWSKPHRDDLTNYFDASGFPMLFQPGPTWVLLAPRGTKVRLSGGRS
jgi:Protein of unknown function (DUF3048) C-terminal domain/Protein of unknown function (DUF3048) N-terminal domain